MEPVDRDLLAATLDEALDALLRVRVVVGRLDEADAPTEALDAALRDSAGVRLARQDLDEAMARLCGVLGSDHDGHAMAVEEAANEVVGRACDATWALAVRSIHLGSRGRP